MLGSKRDSNQYFLTDMRSSCVEEPGFGDHTDRGFRFFLFAFFLFWARISPCSPSWCGNIYVDHAGLKLTEINLPLPPGFWVLRLETCDPIASSWVCSFINLQSWALCLNILILRVFLCKVGLLSLRELVWRFKNYIEHFNTYPSIKWEFIMY